MGASRFSRACEDSSRFVSGFARVRTRHRAVLPLAPYRRRSFVSLDSDSRSALPLPGSRCPLWFSRRAMPLAPRGVTPPHRYPPPLLRHRYAPARAPGAGDSASAFAAHPADQSGDAGIFERPMASGRAIHEEQDQEERRAWPLRASFPVEPSWWNLYYKIQTCPSQLRAATRAHATAQNAYRRYTCRMHTALSSPDRSTRWYRD